MNFNRLFALGALLLSTTLAACAPEAPDGTDNEEESARSDADALSVPFQKLAVTKSAAPAGLTILKSKAQYKAFFGQNPPSSVNFNQSWVVHYSMGVRNTGGYKADIVNVDRTGSGANKHLTITTLDTSPGEACFVTQSLTNPQVTIKINKQSASLPVEQAATFETTDCSQPNWCDTAQCGPAQKCIEETDTCKNSICMLAKCANGYECDDDAGGCVPRKCDPAVADTCPLGFACTNLIQCITTPCPVDYRCHEAPCGTTTFEGECADNVLKYCENNTLHTVDCQSQSCGYDAGHAWYDCL
ncbi:MAG: protease complex subunit PrcB family protein [Polyangiaceae bacterium]